MGSNTATKQKKDFSSFWLLSRIPYSSFITIMFRCAALKELVGCCATNNLLALTILIFARLFYEHPSNYPLLLRIHNLLKEPLASCHES